MIRIYVFIAERLCSDQWLSFEFIILMRKPHCWLLIPWTLQFCCCAFRILVRNKPYLPSQLSVTQLSVTIKVGNPYSFACSCWKFSMDAIKHGVYYELY